MNVIFLDIDGVLNSNEYIKKSYIDRLIFYKAHSFENKQNIETMVKRDLLDIDFYKLQLLEMIVRNTGCKIVVSSSWRRISTWPLIEEYLINKGLPIIGVTPYIMGKRGEEIRTYLKKHKEIESFIILDDERFKDFYELENYLVKTDFYNGGLTEEHAIEAISLLNNIRKNSCQKRKSLVK